MMMIDCWHSASDQAMTNMEKIRYLWHYTTDPALKSIIQSGLLLPKFGMRVCEKEPALWFTKNQEWEFYANKIHKTDGGRDVVLSFKQTAEILGAVRFGIAANDPRLKDWPTSCRIVGTARENRRITERHALKMGSNPLDWCASFEAIPVSDLLVQLWIDGHGWCNDKPND